MSRVGRSGGETLNQREVRLALDYNPDTGVFRWKDHALDGFRRIRRPLIGERAGWVDSETGYRKISLKSRPWLEHRLAWLYMEGEWPKLQVDHQDLDRANSVWTNLRLAYQPLNNGNQFVRADNTSGYKGVSWSRGSRKWWAQISYEGTHHNLGYHVSIEDAARAYDAAARKLFGEFARVNFSASGDDAA